MQGGGNDGGNGSGSGSGSDDEAFDFDAVIGAMQRSQPTADAAAAGAAGGGDADDGTLLSLPPPAPPPLPPQRQQQQQPTPPSAEPTAKRARLADTAAAAPPLPQPTPAATAITSGGGGGGEGSDSSASSFGGFDPEAALDILWGGGGGGGGGGGAPPAPSSAGGVACGGSLAAAAAAAAADDWRSAAQVTRAEEEEYAQPTPESLRPDNKVLPSDALPEPAAPPPLLPEAAPPLLPEPAVPAAPPAAAAAAEEEEEEEALQWSLDVARPRVFVIRASFHLGVVVDTERLSRWLWNVVHHAAKGNAEVVDRWGNTFSLFPSGAVHASTTGRVVGGERELRRRSRGFARSVQRAVAADKQHAGAEGLALPDAADVRFLGYRVVTMWANWRPTTRINAQAALEALHAPKLAASGFHSMLASSGSSVSVTLQRPMPKMTIELEPSGGVRFLAAPDEKSILLVAEVLYQEVLAKTAVDGGGSAA